MVPPSSSMDPSPPPSWFTPKRLLIIFCVINMINYVDRGAIASNGVNGGSETCDDKGICKSGSGIQGEFDLTNFHDGLLSSAFMVGLLVASSIFASLAKSYIPFRLIGVGLSVWTLSVAGCASAFSFWFIAICRMLVGVGEASFISLAAPFIDDNAPVSQKTAWLAMFYMCIPTGIALGYVSGGYVSLHVSKMSHIKCKLCLLIIWVGGHFHWRYAFWGEALLMLPFAVFGFLVKPLQLKGLSPVESKKALAFVETVSSVTDGTCSCNFLMVLIHYWLCYLFRSCFQCRNIEVMGFPSTLVRAVRQIKCKVFSRFYNYSLDVPYKFCNFLIPPFVLFCILKYPFFFLFKFQLILVADSKASKLDGRMLVGGDGIIGDELNKTSKSESIHNILNQLSRFAKDMKVLLVDKVYVVNVFGYIAYNFVIGAYSYWGPKAGYNIYHMKSADMLFGGVTIVCGILGTISGGFILDRMGATISNAFILLSGATFLGAISCFSAFCLRSLYGFIVLFAVGELLVFATQAPVNYICHHCVRPSLRPLSMAISTVSIHIFGDVPSSPLVGILQDHINNWRDTALILTSILFLAAGIWFIGVFLHAVDKSNDGSQPVSTPRITSRKPLLDGNVDESLCEV
ncbi:putative sphingolipid transporter spinster-like protein 2 isoform X1 [Gossypium australe]|uniref:Putative sphingolipid transporter spinster-like protein 2 isoform X1 n=1 Tax=Gossypium australe TaxID=47621 RepID=A0A5B6V4T4_9ROSI|nr:putative sphingolipid transporter spinster-like protein 2 isoform X1 [Gossypium australe]